MLLSDALEKSLAARNYILAALGLDSNWDDHPDHPRGDWKTEIANDETTLGYPEWCAARIENDNL